MINKNIIYLGFVSFFTDMSSSMITTLLPIYVVYILHEGVDKLGIIIAVSTFISYVFRIIFGYISDKYQIVKPFVVAGYFISAITKPLLAFSNTYISIAFLRGTERMGKAIRSAPKDSLISSFSKKGEEGKTFGFHKTMDVAGELSGSLIILIIFMFFTKNQEIIKDIFLFTIIPGLIATLIAFFFVKDTPFKTKSINVIINHSDLKLLPLLFIYFGFIFFIMSEQFLILRAKDFGYTLAIIPLFVILFNLIQVIASYYGGILSDKIGVFRSLGIAFSFGILSIFLINISLWLAFLFLGLFTVLSLNSIRAVISKNATSKGFIYGIFYGGIAVFSSLGALTIGFIWKNYGFETVLKFSEIGMISIFALLIISNFTRKN